MATVRTIMLPLWRNSRLSTQAFPIRSMTGKVQSESPAGPDASKAQGLSKNVLDVPNEPVGPGAAKNKPYKNPEYFCYNTMSYFEAEVEMSKYRLPQPSSKLPMK